MLAPAAWKSLMRDMNSPTCLVQYGHWYPGNPRNIKRTTGPFFIIAVSSISSPGTVLSLKFRAWLPTVGREAAGVWLGSANPVNATAIARRNETTKRGDIVKPPNTNKPRSVKFIPRNFRCFGETLFGRGIASLGSVIAWGMLRLGRLENLLPALPASKLKSSTV